MILILSQEWSVQRSIVVITLLALLTGLLEAPALASNSQKTPFNYEPEKIEPGTLYVYEHYTSSDQEEPEGKKYYYIKSVKDTSIRIEVLSILANEDIELTKYELNMKYMMIKSLEHQALRDKQDLPVDSLWQLELQTDFKEKVVAGQSIHKSSQGMESSGVSYDFHNTPTFFYFFGHMAFRIAMRFYPLAEERIDVWNYQGSKLTGVKIDYNGKETIKAPVGKISCHKFELSGKGVLAWLFGKKARIWMSAEDNRRYMVQYKNNNSTAKWPMKEFRLLRVKKITDQDWAEKIQNAD